MISDSSFLKRMKFILEQAFKNKISKTSLKKAFQNKLSKIH